MTVAPVRQYDFDLISVEDVHFNVLPDIVTHTFFQLRKKPTMSKLMILSSILMNYHLIHCKYRERTSAVLLVEDAKVVHVRVIAILLDRIHGR